MRQAARVLCLALAALLEHSFGREHDGVGQRSQGR